MRTDVVVVGGRCAGSALARLVASRGLGVVVVDRATFPSDTRSTHALSSAGALLLQQWGLLDPLMALGTPVARSVGVEVGQLTGAFPIPDGRPGSMAPRRTILDALLVEAARDAGAVVREGVSFRGVTRGEDGGVIGISARAADGTDLEIEAALVIGADGVDSPVAEAVGAQRYQAAPSVISGVYAYFADLDLEHNSLALGQDRCTLAFPTNDDLVCVAAVVRDDEFRSLVAGGDAAVLAVIRAASEGIGDAVATASRATRYAAFRGRDNRRTVPWGPGWALVGDAGYYRDPITGQGIGDALVSAQLLADAIVDGLGGREPLPVALDRYHRRRDELTAEVYDVTCELSRFAWTDDEAIAHLLRYRAAVDATATAVEQDLWGEHARDAGPALAGAQPLAG